jgi:hypothetical protein
MKKAGKIFRIGLLVFFVVLIAGITFTIGWRPFIGPRKRATTDRKFERTPERVSRGRYLTLGILGCEGCHSPKDWTKHGGPMISGMEFSGQSLGGLIMGFPGTPNVPNITPDPETGAGNWTDDQISRAIREGIKHDGSTLFPMMPYSEYKNLSDEDVAAVVVYLRSITPIKNSVQPMRVNFPVSYLVRSAPEPVTKPVYAPVPSDRIATGKYLVSMGCGCHRVVDSIDFGGGDTLNGPWGEATSANIPSDPSGIGYYDEAAFV